jgi:hypothetical protein
MPNYTFRHRKNGKLKILEMKMAEREDWIKNTPDWEQTIENITVVDPVGIGVTKPPSDFQKYILGPIKEKMGNNNIVGERRWDIQKEI